MRNIVLLFVLIIITISNNTKAQWVQANGPYGGVINCIGSNSWEIFAGTNGGLYRSTDNGSNWQMVPWPAIAYLTNSTLNIYDIYVKDSTVMVSTNNGFWYSKDAGISWNLNHSMPEYVVKFSINGNYIAYINEYSTDYDVLYIAEMDTSLHYLANSFGSLSFQMQNQPFIINSVIFNVNYIVVGTNHGIYISSDTGRTWIRSINNLTDSTINTVVMFSTKIYAGTDTGGIFCSSDSGKTWSSCNKGLTTLSIKTLSVNGDYIYAGTDGSGVFISTDSGVNWRVSNNGLTNTVINRISYHNNIPILGTDGSGIFIYNGQSWMESNKGLTATNINSLACIGSYLFSGTDGGGIYLSTDDGKTWAEVNSGLTNLKINTLAVKGTDLFAGTLLSGIFRSINNGASWDEVNNGIICKHISALTVSGDNIFAGSHWWRKISDAVYSYDLPVWADSGYIYRSSDNGSNWTIVDTGLGYIYNLASLDSNVFASCHYNGFKHSTDLGNSWKDITLTYKDAMGLLWPIAPTAFTIKGKFFFTGTYDGRIFMYDIRDTTWGNINNKGLPRFGHNNHITAIASNDTALFAVCQFVGLNIGLFYSTDEGNTWNKLNVPIVKNEGYLDFNPQINSLYIKGNYLFAGTNSFGIWKASLADLVTDVKDKNNEIPSKYTLEQNYPNPFNPTTIIKYDISEAGFVSLKVYDILGREVQTLVNNYKNKGTYEVNFNGSNLASGVYLYKLKAGSFTSIKKMMLIK